MSYQNALQQYFDGELDDVGEDMLFGELARNHDARREFTEHTRLRAAMQKERSSITPPAHAAGAIFGTLGYDLPAPVPFVPATATGAFALKASAVVKFLPYALTSLLSASTAIGIYAGLSQGSFKNISEITPENPIVHPHKTNAELPMLLKNSGESPQEFSITKAQIAPSKNLLLKQQKSTGSNFQRKSFQPDYPQQSTENAIAVIAKTDFKNEEIFSRETLKESFKTHFSEKIDLDNTELLHQNHKRELQNFSVGMRSNLAQSFPQNSVAAQSDFFKNRVISAFYTIDKNHSIGVEAGREQFAQEFAKNINGREWKVRQNPLYWYGGAAYRFSLADMDFFGFKNTVIPFGQIFAGAAQTGFLGKTQAGFTFVPESRIALVLAAEGSVLLYDVDGAWNNSGKIGLTYGINVSF